MIQSENNNMLLLQNVIRMDSLHKNIIHMLLLKRTFKWWNRHLRIFKCLQKASQDHQIGGVKMTNRQFGQDHTKPNFRLQLALLQKSPKENAKSIFSDVLNSRVLQSTSFSQSVITSIPFYAWSLQK